VYCGTQIESGDVVLYKWNFFFKEDVLFFDSSDRYFAPISLHMCFLYQNIKLVVKIMKLEFAVLN